jgi:hypothetical protein
MVASSRASVSKAWSVTNGEPEDHLNRAAIVDQQAVPEVLRNMPVETLDDLRTRRLVGTNDLAVVFRVESSGE